MKARRTVASDHKIGCVAKAHRRKGQPGGELHRVEIEPTTRCRRGQLYRVCHAGRILIESSLVPGHDACRALLALGLRGTLEVWRPGKASADMRLNIVGGAEWTVEESDRLGLRTVRYRPQPENWGPDVVLSIAVSSRTGAEAISGGPPG